jgi:hypothetical protein
LIRVPGPKTAVEALQWVQEAITVVPARYIPSNHIFDQCSARNISIHDAKRAIKSATSCVPYDGQPENDGTCWRITGPDFEGTETSVGVEAFLDHLGKRAILCTVF